MSLTDAINERLLKEVADNILRQVVCCCGNYRHHGVDWMPKGSDEGLDEAIGILIKLAAVGYQAGIQDAHRMRDAQ